MIQVLVNFSHEILEGKQDRGKKVQLEDGKKQDIRRLKAWRQEEGFRLEEEEGKGERDKITGRKKRKEGKEKGVEKERRKERRERRKE